MKTIQSFTVDHDRLTPGLYVSRIDGDVTTYDLRTRKPNGDDFMDHATMHSLEHLFATAVRNGPMANDILYFGPMGCQTGFYLLVRNADNEAVLKEILRVLDEIVHWQGEMPGNKKKECGNYKNLSLEKGQTEAARYLAVLKNKKVDFQYEV